MMKKIIYGGLLSGHRTYVLSVTGILSAVGAYMIGDIDIFDMLQTIFTLGGIFFLRKSNEKQSDKKDKKGDKNG